MIRSFWISAIVLFFSTSAIIAHEGQETYLKGTISLTPIPTIDNPPEQIVPGRIQSGIEVEIQVKVKNEGKFSSQPGTLLVKYDFPFSTNEKTLFETEKLTLPTLNPGEEQIFKFSKRQRMPTIYDFVRDDWGKREYQAIAELAGHKHTLGLLNLTFSAYYYDIPSSSPVAMVPSLK